MRSGTKRRLGAIERELPRFAKAHAAIIWSCFADAELDRLEEFAQRRAAWDGPDCDWIRSDLTSDERRELDVLLAKVG
jgi:hypothetical protein